MSLSDRLRPGVEAAPWVIEEVQRLESELAEAYAELSKLRGTLTAVYDRDVWARVAKYVAETRNKGELTCLG
jgi:hypothetical protein